RHRVQLVRTVQRDRGDLVHLVLLVEDDLLRRGSGLRLCGHAVAPGGCGPPGRARGGLETWGDEVGEVGDTHLAGRGPGHVTVGDEDDPARHLEAGELLLERRLQVTLAGSGT